MYENKKLNNIFSNCLRILGSQTWGRVLKALEENIAPNEFPEKLDDISSSIDLPEYISDLARIEWGVHSVRQIDHPDPEKIETLVVNPALMLLPVSYKGLPALFRSDRPQETEEIQPADAIHLLIWCRPEDAEPKIRDADDTDLLALKIVVENISAKEAAQKGEVTIGEIDSVLHRAVLNGIVLSPESKVKREIISGRDSDTDLNEFTSADVFTIQWHITQDCDLHCKHCYDRSDRDHLDFEKAVNILDDFYDFCQQMHVRGQVTFTGGNPLLYPRFKEIYGEASKRGFAIAVLGNPTPPAKIDDLIEIQKPAFIQISLEGLEDHNDMIRGKGHFQRSLKFLDQLRKRDIYTMVMLTLTRSNMDQVLPLADILENRTDFFTFNRLSTVGEGAQLLMADPGEFKSFLRKYENQARSNPILGLKDNLFNIIRHENQGGLFGGCTGYGCGAAFNFLAILSDGQVHACRKFPSPIGNILESRMVDIYQSRIAKDYRKGSAACGDCRLNMVCRGCPAIAYSNGLDIFKEKDPFCFFEQSLMKST